MKRVAIIGQRGLVGQKLFQRMCAEQDFKQCQPVFFSASQPGYPAPPMSAEHALQDANDLTALAQCDIILTTQGSDYTQAIYQPLRRRGWSGVWLDAASALRYESGSTLVLDLLNADAIHTALTQPNPCLVGANCTVSLLLMATAALWQQDCIKWMHCSTYQAVSGAGGQAVETLVQESTSQFTNTQYAYNVLPWVGDEAAFGQSQEEWKGAIEGQLLLGRSEPLPLSYLCTRVPVLQCHSQSIIFKTQTPIKSREMADLIASSSPWTRIVPNKSKQTLDLLTPQAVTNSLNIHVGRLMRLPHDPLLWQCFTVGDQLLWGAAEPLRRALRIFIKMVDRGG